MIDEDFKKPNFFIIGAPKCGTTSLFNYLETHPDIFFACLKEPDYFATDFYRSIRDKRRYRRLFRGAEGYKAVGESSTKYLYSEEAVKNILEFNPHAKFIVMTRDPVDMFNSLHYQNLINFNENIKDPKRAWEKQAERKNGESIPSTCKEPSFLQYGEICKLGKQIERLYNTVRDKKKIKIIEFNEFKRETKKIYQEVLEFLEIENDNRGDFPVFGSASELRVKSIKRLFKSISQDSMLKKLSFFIKKKLGIVYWPFLRNLDRWNRKKVNKRALDKDFKTYLINYFKKDQRLLIDVLNKNR